MQSIAAIVLAGGQGRRLGGEDKPGLKIGGLSLAGSVVTAAIRSGVAHVVVVGPERPELIDEVGRAGQAGQEDGAGQAAEVDRAGLANGGGRVLRAHVEFTRERPPGSGPVPALRAGLGLVTEPWTLLLAADLPFLSSAVLSEVRSTAAFDPGGGAGSGGGAGAVLVDDAGRPQWLVSCWRTAELRTALENYSGTSLRGLFTLMPHAHVAVPAPPGGPPSWMDCDTPEDLATAGQWVRGTQVSPPPASTPPVSTPPESTPPVFEELP